MDLSRFIILMLLSLTTVVYGAFFIRSVEKTGINEPASALKASFIGLVANFFDALGIGSFAPTTAFLKFTRLIDERLLPGTLNVGNTLPVLLQAFIFINVVKVDTLTLFVLVVAAVIGSYIGAGIISKLSLEKVKLVMGISLFVVATIMIIGQLGIIKGLGNGTAIGLDSTRLIIGAVIFFILGGLMSAGIGLYAPAMATVYILGLSPLVAFPIMMSACAFLMPVASTKFIKENAYAPKVCLFIAFSGMLGVVFATTVITSLDLQLITWIVVFVIYLTSFIMLKELNVFNRFFKK